MTIEANRSTSETEVEVTWNPESTEVRPSDIHTGVAFFDHMLGAMATHGRLAITVSARGDLDVDCHHLVEDVGIVLGRVLAEGRPRSPVRFGWSVVPMDDALVMVSLDFSGRSYLAIDLDLPPRSFGDFHTENVEDFLRALTANAGITMHVRLIAGYNVHHVLEACFKALGIALGTALAERGGMIPSTKGVLEGPI